MIKVRCELVQPVAAWMTGPAGRGGSSQARAGAATLAGDTGEQFGDPAGEVLAAEAHVIGQRNCFTPWVEAKVVALFSL